MQKLLSLKKQPKKLFLIGAILSALVYLAVSIAVGKDSYRTLDYESMSGFQQVLPRSVDLPFSILTLTGSSEVTLTLTAALFLYFLLRRRVFFFGLSLIVMIFVIEIIGKMIIYHPKPPSDFLRYALQIHLPSSFIVETNYSFPSGHMSRTAFLAVIALYTALTSTMKKQSKIMTALLISCFVILIFISRIYLGEHWMSDVIGGTLLGGSIALFSLSTL